MSAELARMEAATAEPSLTGLTDSAGTDVPDISVVMPCLDEEASVGICVRKAWEGIRRAGLTGEVIVADNGSRDRSVAVAEAAGARVVHQPRRGYGNAYLMGFDAARGKIIVMGDSDDSYDFTRIADLIRPIGDGYEYVLGSRFAGQISRDAMPWSHRRIGNPVLTAILNGLFQLKVSDAHSGFRAITRPALDKIALRSEGMEFASEIVVKAALANLRTAEVPIIYHPRIGVSKLNALRDGWRHLRFLFLHSPDYLFMLPGLVLFALGFFGQLLMLAVPGNPYVLFTKIALALLTLAGSQLLAMGSFAIAHEQDRMADREYAFGWAGKWLTRERGPALASALALAGLPLAAGPFLAGPAALVARGGAASSVAILGLMLIVLGCKLWFEVLFLSLLALGRSGSAARTRFQAGSPATARHHAGGQVEQGGVGLATEAAELGA